MAKIVNVVYKVDDKALLKAKTEIQGIEKETKDSEKEMLKLDKAVKQVGDNGSKSFLNFKNILATISVAGVIAGLAQLGKKIFELGVQQEQLNIAFTTFLGSASKARVLLAELSKFAIVTPFTPDQVNSAAKALLAFGVQGKEIIPTLKMLGDVSAGTGKDLTEMAVIFGQIRSTGRLMGQDLLQLINAGFNPLQVISEKTGKSVAVLKQEMENGAISFQMVSDAFKTATSEGGLFFNLMEKQSVSIGGKLSTVAGNIEETFKNIFNASSGPLADFVDQLGVISEAFLLASKSEDQLAQEMADASSLEKFRKKLSEIDDQLKTNDKGLQQLAISAQNTFAADVVNSINEVSKELEALEQDFQTDPKERDFRIKALKKEKEGLEEVKKELFGLTVGTKTNTAETKLSNEELRKRAQALEAINKQLGFTRAFEKDAENKKNEEKNSKAASDAITLELKQAADRAEILKANNKDVEDEITRQLEEAADERIRIANEEAANREAAIQRSYDLALELGAQALANTLMQREIDTQSISDKYERELELAGDNERAKKELEKKRDLELEIAQKRNKEIQKRNARNQVAIDTAVAIIKTFAQFGYPWGIIPAALMAATAAVQIRNINKYKKGKVNIDGPGTGTSDSIPAMISKGESVINADATSKSKNLLEAINSRKIDDGVLQNIAVSGGSRAVAIDYERLGEEFRKGRESYETHGYTIMKGVQKGKNFKQFIRSKVQGY